MHSELGSPIDVRGLLEPERDALLELLSGLTADDWAAPTACPRWSVHDVAVHLLHDDVRRLSAQRDGHEGPIIPATSLDELVGGLDDLNNRWVAEVAPTLSPRLTCEILSFISGPANEHLRSLPFHANEAGVAWAGRGPHPTWLDVAREFTERWVHQQQIRLATHRPGCDEPTYVDAVVDTFVRALPVSLPSRPAATEVALRISDPVHRQWVVRSDGGRWTFEEPPGSPSTVVELPAASFWQRAVRMADVETVRQHARVEGDPGLVASVLNLRAAIVPDDETG